MKPRLSLLVCLLSCFAPLLQAQSAPPAHGMQDASLQFVVYLSRHGVRSPTGKAEQYDVYSAALWPEWSVAPGYLTAHGYRLMQLFGSYDRVQLAGEGLITAAGCEDASRVTFYADSDQRTQETGKALSAGLFPGCAPTVKALPEGTNDPLFHPTESGNAADAALGAAAIAGRIGGDPNNLTAAYRPLLTELDTIFAKCGTPAGADHKRTSILEIPAKLSAAQSDQRPELRGPLNTASTLTENLLLEYTEGMDTANVGWGCVNGDNLRELITLHTAASEYTLRPKAIAQAQASNLGIQIREAMEQAATGKRVAGAISRVDDRALFLVGHDTNLSTLAGLLDLNWIADQRRDDTPPGSALVFELWRSRADQQSAGQQNFVRVYFTTQTLEQMRSGAALTSDHPPVRVPVFLPGCSRADLSCSWPQFEQMLLSAVSGDRR